MAVLQCLTLPRGTGVGGLQRPQVAEVGVDVVGVRIVKLGVGGVNQDRDQAAEAPERKVNHEGELETDQEG